MAMSDPVVITDPTITIDGVEYVCAASKVALVPEDDNVDISTFCNPKGTRPGATSWGLTVTLKMSYDDGVDTGAWNSLFALRKTKVPVVISPATGAASPSNPTAAFDAYIPSIPLVNAEVGQTFEYELSLSSVGEPVFTLA